MGTISNVCTGIAAVLMFVTPILFVIWLVKIVCKKPAKKIRKIMLLGIACFFIFLIVGTFTDPATYCNHEYELIDHEAATCETNGFEKYHCKLCGRDNTETQKKLGHDMVDVRRVEPTYDTDGEYVRQCTRCGYEEREVLEKLAAPIEEEPSKESPIQNSSAQTQEVTFEDIYLAYKENELVADDKYHGNRYEITARVDAITTSGLMNLTGGATLTMDTVVNGITVYFIAEFEKDQEDALKKIKVGEYITFKGTCLSAGMWEDCEIIG